MKQCPQCGSTYSDDTLNFCLTDRASLVPAGSGDDTTTIVRDHSPAPATQIINASNGVSPVFKYLVAALGLLLLLVTAAAITLWSRRDRPAEQTKQASNATVATPDATPVRSVGNFGAKDNANATAGTPVRSPSPTQTPRSVGPQSDPGVSRITFSRGSVSKTVAGTAVLGRRFVLRTMSGQSLRATVNSANGCVQFTSGGSSVAFETPNGDVSLDLKNTCDEPSSFSMNVTVR